MERKLGEVFDCNGVKLCVKEDIECCVGCYFYENNISCSHYNDDTGECDCIGRTDGKRVIFEEVKNMEERVIKLTLEKAKEFYKKGGEFRDLALSAFTEYELKRLPKTWEEFCKAYPIKDEEGYIFSDSDVIKAKSRGEDDDRDPNDDRNILPSIKDAKSHLALMQLHQLRDYYRQGWKPNWENMNLYKYSIILNSNTPKIVSSVACNCFLSFQSEEIAKEFLNNFRDLIIKAGDLI